MTHSAFPSFVPEICFDTPQGRQCYPIFSLPTVPPGPVVPATGNNPGPHAWAAYRQFSSALQLLGLLEERAPMELDQLAAAERSGMASRFERAFLIESFRQSARAAHTARSALSALRAETPDPVLDSCGALAAALRQRVPDMAEDVSKALDTTLRAHGTPGGWMRTVLAMLDARCDLYTEIARRLRSGLETGCGEEARRARGLLEALHKGDPRATPAPASEPLSLDTLRADKASAEAARTTATASGAAEITAGAGVRAVAQKAQVLAPELLGEIGCDPDPRPQSILFCIVGGPCWWKVTGIAIAIAISSHGVE